MSAEAILLSGGIDSTALAHWRRPAVALTVDYGQAAAAGEIRAAAQIARELGLSHEIIKVDCGALGCGDLIGAAPARDAPAPEWWPYRNQFLVTVAAMRAYALGVSVLVVGSVKSDGFHVDGRLEFYEQLDTLMAMQEGALRVIVPAINMTSEQLVRASATSAAILHWTHSCHTDEFACGRCRGCWKHAKVMEQLGYGSAPVA